MGEMVRSSYSLTIGKEVRMIPESTHTLYQMTSWKGNSKSLLLQRISILSGISGEATAHQASLILSILTDMKITSELISSLREAETTVLVCSFQQVTLQSSNMKRRLS